MAAHESLRVRSMDQADALGRSGALHAARLPPSAPDEVSDRPRAPDADPNHAQLVAESGDEAVIVEGESYRQRQKPRRRRLEAARPSVHDVDGRVRGAESGPMLLRNGRSITRGKRHPSGPPMASMDRGRL
jgi:hypothetical protein